MRSDPVGVDTSDFIRNCSHVPHPRAPCSAVRAFHSLKAQGAAPAGICDQHSRARLRSRPLAQRLRQEECSLASLGHSAGSCLRIRTTRDGGQRWTPPGAVPAAEEQTGPGHSVSSPAHLLWLLGKPRASPKQEPAASSRPGGGEAVAGDTEDQGRRNLLEEQMGRRGGGDAARAGETHTQVSRGSWALRGPGACVDSGRQGGSWCHGRMWAGAPGQVS